MKPLKGFAPKALLFGWIPKELTIKNKANEWIFLPMNTDFMFQQEPVCMLPYPFSPGAGI